MVKACNTARKRDIRSNIMATSGSAIRYPKKLTNPQTPVIAENAKKVRFVILLLSLK